jgi:hypothetical protein
MKSYNIFSKNIFRIHSKIYRIPLTKEIIIPVFQGLYQSILGYFQIVNMETNLHVVGFEALSAEKQE